MLGVAPTDLLAQVSLDSSLASLDFQEASWQEFAVYDPAGKQVTITSDLLDKEGPLRLLYSFLTPIEGIYEVRGKHDAFCLPILGRTYACRNKLLLHTPLCDCHTELDKSLRTLDVLVSCVVALANEGDKENAAQLFLMATTLICDCDCHA